MNTKPTIDELERLLNLDDDQVIEILPNGEIIRRERADSDPPKPLTFRGNFGGEYGGVA